MLKTQIWRRIFWCGKQENIILQTKVSDVKPAGEKSLEWKKKRLPAIFRTKLVELKNGLTLK
jgi:hypothetical protein